MPFLARARTSRPVNATGMASSWMGEGFSKPASKIPMSKSRFKAKFSNSRPFVFVTSCCPITSSTHHQPSIELWWAMRQKRRTNLCLLSGILGGNIQVLFPVVTSWGSAITNSGSPLAMDEWTNFLLAQGVAITLGSLRRKMEGHSNLNWVFCN